MVSKTAFQLVLSKYVKILCLQTMFSRNTDADDTFGEHEGPLYDIQERVQDISSNWKVVTVNNLVHTSSYGSLWSLGLEF